MAERSSSVGETATRAAARIYEAYLTQRDRFNEITRRAPRRFARRDWPGMQLDAAERLEVYSFMVEQTLAGLGALLGKRFGDPRLWRATRQAYAALLRAEPNPELAETFYNSTTRKVFSTVGVKEDIEFFTLVPPLPRREPDPSLLSRHPCRNGLRETILQVLGEIPFPMDGQDMAADATHISRALESRLSRLPGSPAPVAIETVPALFFRNKAAYVVGRLCFEKGALPLVIPLLNRAGGIRADAVLTEEEQVSIVFSFTRSYFHVETDRPQEVILFLKSILPLKPVDELYVSVGLNKHGKTLLYRNLQRHLRESDDRFEIAAGEPGMVMVVFTLPSYDVVFKVIRDRFAYPKTSTRKEVKDSYRMVFQRDRVGRLVDAQEFEHLKFSRERFSEATLKEILRQAGSTIRVEEDSVVMDHLYTERRLAPLNLYLREVSPELARAAVMDYGHAIKDLAAANIFPGDFLLKNFGVTRHGRVVFYDYDELCLVTDSVFREIPAPRTPEEELDSAPWFSVGENDIFPVEFRRFLGLSGPLQDFFARHHGELFTTAFWQQLQDRHRRGEIMDIFPYPEQVRLRRDEET
jgi:isocitrate dehydrogenase kinase/phosphatase